MKKLDFIFNKRVVSEIIDNNLGIADTMMPDGNESEIQTGPIPNSSDFSDYEKGISPTTDDVRTATSQGRDWQAAYTGMRSYISNTPGINSAGWVSHMFENTNKVIEKIVDKTISDMDVLDKIEDKEIKNDKVFVDIVKKVNAMDKKRKTILTNIISDAKSISDK